MTLKSALIQAYVLHTRNYRETSLIVDCFTRSAGRMHSVAKGAKRPRSPFKHVLQAFNPLLISWIGKGELVTLTHTELSTVTKVITPDRLMCGFYLNELLTRLLASHDPHPHLFDCYEQTLNALRNAKAIAPALRCFEKHLLQELGYGIAWLHDTTGQALAAEGYYQVHPERGLLALDKVDEECVHDPWVITAATARAIATETWQELTSLQESRRILRLLLNLHWASDRLR